MPTLARYAWLFATSALAGSTVLHASELLYSQPAPIATDATPRNQCDAQAVKILEGQPYTADLPERARQAAGAAEVRVLRPGDFITKEYMMERLTIIVDDEQRTVLRVRCG